MATHRRIVIELDDDTVRHVHAVMSALRHGVKVSARVPDHAKAVYLAVLDAFIVIFDPDRDDSGEQPPFDPSDN